MKAEVKFVRLDIADVPEEELVFEIIPNSGDGVYVKNRWLLRVAQCFVDTRAGGGSNILEKQIELAKEQIETVMGIKNSDAK